MMPDDIFFHSNWNGVIEHGNNAAALYFRNPIGVNVPTLADSKLTWDKIGITLAIKVGNDVEMAVCNCKRSQLYSEIAQVDPSFFCSMSSSLDWQQGTVNNQ